MRKLYLSVTLILLFNSMFHAQANEAASEDFKCTFLISDGEQSLRRFTLTAEVYSCLMQKNGADLSIENAEGQAIPFYLGSLAPTVEIEDKSYHAEMTFYPEPQTPIYKTGEQIKRIAQLTGVASGQESDTQWQQKNTYYSSLILEKKMTSDRLKTITINTLPQSKPISATLIIEESDDLQHWVTALYPHALYLLPGDQATLKKDTFTLNSEGQAKYLRIAILSNSDHFLAFISSVSAYYQHITSQPIQHWQWLSIVDFKALDHNEWAFSLPGLFPVSRIVFAHADNIALYQGSIYAEYYVDPSSKAMEVIKESRHVGRKENVKNLIKNTLHVKPRLAPPVAAPNYQYRGDFNQYRLITDTETVMSPEIHIGITQSKNWKLRFTQPDAINVSQLPTIKLGWEATQITFITQGSGPFRLRAGKAEKVTPIRLPTYFLNYDHDPEVVTLFAETGSEINSPLPASTATPSKNTHWSRFLLWSILLLGVLLMGYMAYQLAKKMKLV